MGMRIPPRHMAFGNPAKVVRELTPDERAVVHGYAEKYVRLAEYYRNAGIKNEPVRTNQPRLSPGGGALSI
jgi:carbonic anhydrase/acetyltransferase-like protein (isoleucine patch superfamily)